MFARQVRQQGDRPALESSRGAWSYRELDRASARVAATLRRRQLRRGDLVAVLCARSPELVACWLGVVRAGGVFLPIDPGHPNRRIATLFDDARPRFVVHQAELLDRLPRKIAASRIEIGAAWLETAERPPPLPARWRAGQAAYAMFTSGSTGRPKAVLLPHMGLANLAAAQAAAFRVTPRSRVLQFSSPAFDASISEIFATLTAGGTLVMADPAELLPGARLVRALQEHRITHLTIPPTLLGELPVAELPDLQTLVVAGEACSAEIASQWSAGRQLINAYGPTETTVCATLYSCPSGRQPRPPIGKPITNCRAYVLDDRGRPCADGQTGELYLGGPGVGLGYLNCPEQTAQRFLPDHFDTRATARMYRSGDLARRNREGQLEFVGRVDDQLQIRGIRVEPGEVAAALEAVPGVRQAAVLAERSGSRQRLAAFVTTRGGEAPSTQSLVAQLRRRLPPHLVPARVERVERFPRLASGKIDLAALAGQNESRLVKHVADPTPPRTKLERDVLAIFEQVLSVDGLGMEDDFFTCGGDSLAAMELLFRLERQLARQLDPRELLAAPTPAALVRTLSDRPRDGGHPLIVPLAGDQDARPLFCVHPGGGNALCYFDLARAMEPQFAVYGVQSPGLVDTQSPPETIEELAEEYLAAIRSLTSGRPFHLCGWSFGGVVAFEMAKRLAVGERAGPVVLVDCGRRHAFAVLRELMPDLKVPLYQIPWLEEEQLFAAFRGQTRDSRLIPDGAEESLTRRIFRVFVSNVEATLRYEPGRLEDDVVFVEAAQPIPGSRRAPSDEWRDRCRRLTVITTPGSHLTLIRPPLVRQLAETLKNVFPVAIR